MVAAIHPVHNAFAIYERCSKSPACICYGHLVYNGVVLQDIVGKLYGVGKYILLREAAQNSSRFTILYFLSTSVTYYLHIHPFRLEENKFVLAHIGGISFVCKFFFAYYVNG